MRFACPSTQCSLAHLIACDPGLIIHSLGVLSFSMVSTSTPRTWTLNGSLSDPVSKKKKRTRSNCGCHDGPPRPDLVRPAARDDLGFRIEIHAVFAQRMQITKE